MISTFTFNDLALIVERTLTKVLQQQVVNQKKQSLKIGENSSKITKGIKRKPKNQSHQIDSFYTKITFIKSCVVQINGIMKLVFYMMHKPDVYAQIQPWVVIVLVGLNITTVWLMNSATRRKAKCHRSKVQLIAPIVQPTTGLRCIGIHHPSAIHRDGYSY